MNQNTIRLLNKLNREFYVSVGNEFSDTRQFAWKGWDKLLPMIKVVKSDNTLRVLDVGCGNGRFGEWLTKQLGSNQMIDYTGIDNNKTLLVEAVKRLHNIKSRFENIDLIDELLKSDDSNVLKKIGINDVSGFNLVVCFGVMHHVPGFSNRVKLLQEMLELVNKDGILVVSLWQFIKDKRLKEKSEKITKKLQKKLKIKLEANDYFLDWRAQDDVVRYCHVVNDDEVHRLMREADVKIVTKFFADGKSGDLNRYLVLKSK